MSPPEPFFGVFQCVTGGVGDDAVLHRGHDAINLALRTRGVLPGAFVQILRLSAACFWRGFNFDSKKMTGPWRQQFMPNQAEVDGRLRRARRGRAGAYQAIKARLLLHAIGCGAR